jgi:hypothetical protein
MNEPGQGMFRSYFKKVTVCFTLAAFTLSGVGPSYAGLSLGPGAGALSLPGEMVGMSRIFTPPLLKGVRVYADDPLRFEFILDKGEEKKCQSVRESECQRDLKVVSDRLIKYFLASLTIPEKDLWVNLSPYEQERIIPDEFGLTEMGRDLLAQDYFLKQLTSSLLSPDTESGRKFWQAVYSRAARQLGTTDIPADMFNKVWIIPEKSVVYEKTGVEKETATAYVVESRLKVMLDSDYLAESKEHGAGASQVKPLPPNSLEADITRQLLREIIIPILEQEVNEGENFARLRQIYNSLILAAWYKKKVTESALAAVYVDKKKTAGVAVADKDIGRKIWGEYVKAFQKGAFNFIREETDALSGELIPRKYFSGGIVIAPQLTYVLQQPARFDDVRSVVALKVSLDPAQAQGVVLKPDRRRDLSKDSDMVGQGHGSVVKKALSSAPLFFDAAQDEFEEDVRDSEEFYLKTSSDGPWVSLSRRNSWQYMRNFGDLVSLGEKGIFIMGFNGSGKSRLAYRLSKKGLAYHGSDQIQMIGKDGHFMGGPSTVMNSHKTPLSYKGGDPLLAEGELYPVKQFVPISAVVFLVPDGNLTDNGRVESFGSVAELAASFIDEDAGGSYMSQIRDMRSGMFYKLSFPLRGIPDEELDRLADIIIFQEKKKEPRNGAGNSQKQPGDSAQKATMPDLNNNSVMARKVVSVNNLGGIDFNSEKIDLMVKGSAQGMKFKLDPVVMRRMADAPGFSPVILDMAEITDLRSFLEAS